MNCLSFVFLPRGIEPRERLDRLHNEHVARSCAGPVFRKALVARAFQHRHSLARLARHLPTFLAARRQFVPRS